ncbi:MAG: sugar ABC transporter ATP-binding protein [Victivallales bacterium]|nr:sugar ABC transporter ATP-binding protein [Victivallales bacterium]
MPTDEQPIFEMRGVCKSFGAVRALCGVDLTVHAGEVHALVGENGAGKSTLMKVLSGAHRADAGEVRMDGASYAVTSPVQARRCGVAMIYQELNLAPDLSVAQNLVLGMETSRFGFARDPRRLMREKLAMLDHGHLDLDTPVRELAIGTQQVVEIARALVSEARLVIMDEPTSSLSAADAEALFRVVRRLADAGIAVIYISHFLEEIQRLADRYTVLRDGETVGTGTMDGVTLQDIVRLMVGRELDEMFPYTPHEIGETVLDVQGLRGRRLPEDANLQLRRGEILGIAGLVGSGRSETVRGLFGLERVHGTVTVDGKALRIHSYTPGKALRDGFDLLSEDRKEEGLATNLPIRLNACLSSLGRLATFGFISDQAERQATEVRRQQLNIKCESIDHPVSSLSGGNQQKVALARILHHDSDVLFLDEPTRGIDVGSKAEICRLIGELAARGKAVVVISSYLPELMGVCDTLAVMHRGRLSPARPMADWTEESIMFYATAGRLSEEVQHAGS